jgi:hypothetical protein
MKASEIKKEINAELSAAREKSKELQQSKITSFVEVQVAIESIHEDTKLLALHIRQNFDRLIQVQKDLEAQFIEFELDHQEELIFVKDILQKTKKNSTTAATIDENFKKLLLDDIEEKNRATIEQVKRIIINNKQKNKPMGLLIFIGILIVTIAILVMRS